MLGRPLDPEEVHLRAKGQHQVVVAQRVHLGEPDLAGVQIHRRHLGRMDPGVRLVVEQVTKRMSDGALRKQVGGDLIQQRLERVIVVSVDDDHVDVRLAQLPRGADPRESPAQDDDART